MTRDQVLSQLRQERSDLEAAFADVPDETPAAPPVVEWWSWKDVMGHISLWHQTATQFVDEHLRGGVPTPLGADDDAAVDRLNKRGAAYRRDWPPARVREELYASFRDLYAAVEKLDDAALDAPLPAPWTDGVTLERLIAWNSYEHAPEHIEQIDRWKKSRSAA